jgi:hypothetical protein
MPFADIAPTVSSQLECPEDLIDSILSWSPETLLAENKYEDEVLALPHLPQTHSASTWKDAYKPAVRANTYSDLSQALLRPDKLVRKIRHTPIKDARQQPKDKPLGSRSVVFKLYFHTNPDLRPLDFVFISPSAQPWEETAATCAQGIVRGQEKVNEQDHHEAVVEIPRGYAQLLETFGDTGDFNIIMISSIASGYRIFAALCDADHTELLMDHILQPRPLAQAGMTAIHPRQAAVIEHIAA